MPHATSPDGHRIHYALSGDEGPVVVLIQGLGLSSRFWVDVPESLHRAPAPYRVLLVDNRGTGQSGRPSRRFSVADMADDVACALDAAGIAHAYVVGISMGGMIAQQVAIRHPRRVLGLVLLATTPGLPHSVIPPVRSLGMLAQLPFASIGGGRERLFREMFFASRPPPEGTRLASFLMSHWGPLLDIDRTDARSYFRQFAAVVTHSTGFQLSRITCPTHVVAGADDLIVPARNAEILARRIRGATLELLPGIGHAIPVEDREVVLRAVERVRERAQAGKAAA